MVTLAVSPASQHGRGPRSVSPVRDDWRPAFAERTRLLGVESSIEGVVELSGDVALEATSDPSRDETPALQGLRSRRRDMNL
jgi:hypothetical protein